MDTAEEDALVAASLKEDGRDGSCSLGKGTSSGNGQSALGQNWEPSSEVSKVWEAGLRS